MVRFAVNGNPVEVLAHAYRPNEVTLTIGKKTIPAEKLFKIVGAMPRCLAGKRGSGRLLGKLTAHCMLARWHGDQLRGVNGIGRPSLKAPAQRPFRYSAAIAVAIRRAAD